MSNSGGFGKVSLWADPPTPTPSPSNNSGHRVTNKLTTNRNRTHLILSYLKIHSILNHAYDLS